jgi:DNA-binding MarR family transcriptional regulator
MSDTSTPKRSESQRAGATQAILDWHAAVPDDRLAHLVRDARRGLGRCLQMRLVEHGVASGHWTFLRILWVREGFTQRELSELAGVMEPTAFAALHAMEKLGYVTRQRRPDNRKNIYVYLTDEGRALREKLVPLAEEINGMAVQGLSAEEVAVMRKGLHLMIENLATYEEGAVNERRRVPSTRELARLARGEPPRGAASQSPSPSPARPMRP